MSSQLAGHTHPVGIGHIKSAFALIAGKAGGNHFSDHRVVTANRVECITIWQNGAKRGHNICHQINAD